jgi:uncharacterized protein
MSDENRADAAGKWGRPLRKRSRGPQPQPATGGTPVVGPVDHPLPPDEAGAIVRAPEANGVRPVTHRNEPGAEDVKLRDLVVYITRGLVDHPDDVSVGFLSVTAGETSLELRVHPDDLGHVIGKLGRTARSVRLTLGAAASKLGRRANLEIAD